MAFLELVDLDKRYTQKGNLIVKHMNLSIHKGEFLVFLGPSGCGKTTTIRMISGLEEISGGDILINGKSVVSLPPKDRGVSMIFQSYAVWPHMTVRENIAYPLRLQKVSKKDIVTRVEKAAAAANIMELLDRYPTQLSGGQRQRVAVARAIVVEPQIFLMDEPLSNLDAMLRVSMRSELKNIHESLGATSIFVTHDQSEAMSLADRIVIMKDGLIEQIGTPKDVYFDCESIFVASFIGVPPTNFFHVSVLKDDAGLLLKSQDVSYRVDALEEKMLSPYVGKEVVMGVRPENLEISDTFDDNTFLTTHADFIEPQGSHIIVISKLESSVIKISSSKLELQAKSLIHVSVKDRKAMFFDKDTEKRIRLQEE
ncbi:MAG: ABC transporter ATP-binding protein [Bacilli bacterium]|nr:ABC transporter ATP-binding protein [Bacilli bacterium]MBN2696392.1 ABC transporter ATP-binding protein [Bacilli bacterium]